MDESMTHIESLCGGVALRCSGTWQGNPLGLARTPYTKLVMDEPCRQTDRQTETTDPVWIQQSDVIVENYIMQCT